MIATIRSFAKAAADRFMEGYRRSSPGRPQSQPPARPVRPVRRAKRGLGNRGPTYGKLAKAARDDPEAHRLLALVDRGELSPTEALITLGLRKQRDRYGDLCSTWKLATDEERQRFRVYAATWRKPEPGGSP
jgi:hypothetical protein